MFFLCVVSKRVQHRPLDVVLFSHRQSHTFGSSGYYVFRPLNSESKAIPLTRPAQHYSKLTLFVSLHSQNHNNLCLIGRSSREKVLICESLYSVLRLLAVIAGAGGPKSSLSCQKRPMSDVVVCPWPGDDGSMGLVFFCMNMGLLHHDP